MFYDLGILNKQEPKDLGILKKQNIEDIGIIVRKDIKDIGIIIKPEKFVYMIITENDYILITEDELYKLIT